MAEVTGMTPEKIAQEITNVKSYVDGGLSEKADKSQVASDLSKKADKTQVNTDLSKKADITQVNTELSKKSDTTYVDTELSKKADITQVNLGLSKKADITQVNTDLSKKADTTYVDSELSKKADTTQVTSDLSKKADITYVNQKDWDRGNIPNSTKSLDELKDGSWGLSAYAPRTALGLSSDSWGNILLQTWGLEGTNRTAIYTDVGTDNRAPKMWVSYKRGGVWSGWSDSSKTYDLELENVDSRIQNIEDDIQKSLVNSSVIRRIITSANPDEHLSEGDLLLVTEAPEYLYRRLDSMVGLTQRWVVDRWDIAADSLDGDSVSLHTSGPPARRAVSVDSVSGLVDVEVVTKLKASGHIPSGSSPGVMLRGSGEPGSEVGYTCSVGSNSVRIGKFVNGKYTLVGEAPATVPTGEWFWFRARAFGTSIQMKIWPDGSPEPAEWGRSVTDSSVGEGGWVGPTASTNPSDIYFHSIGVAALTSGDEQAPTEAV